MVWDFKSTYNKTGVKTRLGGQNHDVKAPLWYTQKFKAHFYYYISTQYDIH